MEHKQGTPAPERQNGHDSAAAQKRPKTALGLDEYDEEVECQAALEAAKSGDQNALRYNRAVVRVADRRALINQLMIEAATYGHANVVQMCKDWGADDYNRAMAYAAVENHTHIMELCKGWGATLYGWAMRNAAHGGHKETVELCQKWRAAGQEDDDPHNEDTHAAVMCAAAWKGHGEIVKLCDKWGVVTAEGRYAAMLFAKRAGHGDIARLCGAAKC